VGDRWFAFPPCTPEGYNPETACLALVFVEPGGPRVEWNRELGSFEMTESEVVNEWIRKGEARGKLTERRQTLLEALTLRFPGAVPEEVVRLINEQESQPLLEVWFRAALRAYTFEQFLDVLKQ
jgi:hypothetical protein